MWRLASMMNFMPLYRADSVETLPFTDFPRAVCLRKFQSFRSSQPMVTDIRKKQNQCLILPMGLFLGTMPTIRTFPKPTENWTGDGFSSTATTHRVLLKLI